MVRRARVEGVVLGDRPCGSVWPPARGRLASVPGGDGPYSSEGTYGPATTLPVVRSTWVSGGLRGDVDREAPRRRGAVGECRPRPAVEARIHPVGDPVRPRLDGRHVPHEAARRSRRQWTERPNVVVGRRAAAGRVHLHRFNRRLGDLARALVDDPDRAPTAGQVGVVAEIVERRHRHRHVRQCARADVAHVHHHPRRPCHRLPGREAGVCDPHRVAALWFAGVLLARSPAAGRERPRQRRAESEHTPLSTRRPLTARSRYQRSKLSRATAGAPHRVQRRADA